MIFKSYNVNRGPTDRRGRSCAVTVPTEFRRTQGPVLCRPLNNVPTSFKNMSNIACGPAQDRPLRSADLADDEPRTRNVRQIFKAQWIFPVGS